MPRDPMDRNRPTPPDEPFDLYGLVLLALTAATVYVAYRNPAFGAALTVGVLVLLALHTLVKRR
ncbi:hypothetical protein [Streptomyces sp. NPDC051183]|uniref:hypothetical protein n=1 Tax=unclassified Streptomyces TaxID=2593676 RepID=UPI003425469F